MNTKVLILGHARHGKDYAAEYWREYFGMTFQSSSEAAAEIFIYDKLSQKYGYTSHQECYLDRMNRRSEWYDLICDFNLKNKTRLCEAILEKNNCYVGMRSDEEVSECRRKELFDIIVWIDAAGRVPAEDKSSCTVSSAYADIIIENKTTLEDFENKLNRIGKLLFQ